MIISCEEVGKLRVLSIKDERSDDDDAEIELSEDRSVAEPLGLDFDPDDVLRVLLTMFVRPFFTCDLRLLFSTRA